MICSVRGSPLRVHVFVNELTSVSHSFQCKSDASTVYLPILTNLSQYSNVAHGPRNAEFFRDARFREATRLIEIKLYLVSRSQLRFYTPSPDLEDLKTRYPTLFFCGVSRGVSGNEAKVEGNVCIGIDGTIRWTFVSAYVGIHISLGENSKKI